MTRPVLASGGRARAHRVVAKHAGLARGVAEARDLRAPLALGQPTVVGDVGDEQAASSSCRCR
jgi:hypothetical protein